MSQRLEKLPSDMDELYANIFARMNTRDQEEAKVVFQLVCFAVPDDDSHGLNLRQLKEAVAFSQNSIHGFARDDSTDGFGRFRNRLKAKSGGLLEEIVHEGVTSRYTPKTQEELEMNGGSIKLIYRIAQAYLEREGWFLG